jgi:zinc transport system substrate-binding protein
MKRAILISATVALLATAGSAGTAGCAARSAAGDGKLRVVAAFYPLQYVAEQVGGDRVLVSNLVKPGAEPHDLELQPNQVAELSRANLVVYLRGFQPAVDEGVDQQAKDKSVDAAAVGPLHEAPPGSEEPGEDPHIWLDPTRFAAVADKVAEWLAKVDEPNRDAYLDRAHALRTKLVALDEEFNKGLAQCQRREIVTSHAAFGYLADRYKLTQIPITGLSPEEEPTPQRLAAVAQQARQHKATTIFFETLVSPKVAQSLASEIGAKAEVLDPIEGIDEGSSEDYLSVMRSNLSTLRGALGCT